MVPAGRAACAPQERAMQVNLALKIQCGHQPEPLAEIGVIGDVGTRVDVREARAEIDRTGLDQPETQTAGGRERLEVAEAVLHVTRC